MSIFINDIMVKKIKRSDYIEKVKTKLATAFEIIDMDPINFYL